MNFKEWFILETSAVAEGPFKLYHGTDTGLNNRTMKQFQKYGAKNIGSGYGQGGGFFVLTNLEIAQYHALTRSKVGNLTYNVKQQGQPMVVVIEVPSIDFSSQWDLDLEKHGGDILKYTHSKMSKINQLGVQKHSPHTVDYLSKDKNTTNKVDFSQLGNTFDFDDSDTFDNSSNNPSRGYKHAAKKLAPFYYAHGDANPEKHSKLKKWFFLQGYKSRIDLALKYLGNTPLPVKEILVHDGEKWNSDDVESIDHPNYRVSI